MIDVPDLPPGQWLTTLGWDGAVHIIPTGEEHVLHFGCVCDPIPHRYYTGGMSFTHRSLSC